MAFEGDRLGDGNQVMARGALQCTILVFQLFFSSPLPIVLLPLGLFLLSLA